MLTERVHHSQITPETSAQIMALRPDYVASGRPDNHPYAVAVSMIDYDAPAIGVRNGDTYVVLSERLK